MPVLSREWRLTARPVGEPKPADFTLVTTTVADPGPGQVLVRNDWMSVDPYMRGRMRDRKSYIAPFQLGEVMEGSAVGSVVASRSDEAPVGAAVTHFLGWREYTLADAAAVRVIDTALPPAPAYLGVLGAPGLTAYVGLTQIAPVRDGDIVFVSGAAGAVGTVAGTLARLLGAATVIGSTGGPDKARRLVDDLGYDVGLDYRKGALSAQLAEAAPNGIDVYFDNVGGDHLQAALDVMNNHGRIVLCGAISGYNDDEPTPGPNNLTLALTKRLTLRGMHVDDHRRLAEQYNRRAAAWLEDGSLRVQQSVTEGFENAVGAFLSMMRGGNTGKTLVRLTHR
jgi:NADPH-dependent curcumin reductase CurA